MIGLVFIGKRGAVPEQKTIGDYQYQAPSPAAITGLAGTALVKEVIQTIAEVPEQLTLRHPLIPEPELQAKIVLVKELNTNTELLRLEKEFSWPFASLTKLLTAVVAAEEVGWDKKVTISESALASEGTAGNLIVGQVYRIGELVKAMMLVSSNDAAAAIAEFYGIENFLAAMKQKAAAIGMINPVFVDATGVSPFNRGTADDMARLAEYILKKYPGIFKVTAAPNGSIFEETSGRETEFLNINSFAGRPDFLGGKTGFTDEASGNLVSLFNHEGRTILVIIMGTPDRFGETEMVYNWIKNAYAF